MTVATEDVSTQALTLPEEIILMLLNEENGYFYQVPGWRLNCAVIGAVLAELSFLGRIDTDMESLFLVDATETGDPVLDPVLKEIAGERAQRNAQYWIERLAPRAESIIDLTLDRLVELSILEHHDGEFWTLARRVWKTERYGDAQEGTAGQFIRTRIGKVIFTQEIPDPRDVVIICLVNSCDVFRLIFQLDAEDEERIDFICRMDLIGRSLAAAVVTNISGSVARRSRLAKQIPRASLRRMLMNRHLRSGNLPALFADLAKEYGPVFELGPPLGQPMVVLAGPQANGRVNRHGRRHLRARDYFADFEQVYGASGVLPSLDGADHFRLRRAMAPGVSRARLAESADQLFHHAHAYMTDWTVGDTYPARSLCRRMINCQLSPLLVSVNSQDIIDDLVVYKERALNVHILKCLPKFMLKTPGMKRRAKAVETLLERVYSVHTSAQRVGCPRNLADDWLGLHASDPQFVPESNLRFALSAALIASVYLGDAFSCALYAMASQPELHARIRTEADIFFEDGVPDAENFTLSAMDVTRRFIMECMRMYPIVPMSMRHVMNTWVVENYEMSVGTRVAIAQTASHYMEEVFPDPFTFDIDRYKDPRNEHRGPGYAPYGLGTHRCLGYRWMELQLGVNLLLVARYFRIEVSPTDYKFRFSPFPSLKPSKNLGFRIAEQLRELPGDRVA